LTAASDEVLTGDQRSEALVAFCLREGFRRAAVFFSFFPRDGKPLLRDFGNRL
jgi:hypothetical protein